LDVAKVGNVVFRWVALSVKSALSHGCQSRVAATTRRRTTAPVSARIYLAGDKGVRNLWPVAPSLSLHGGRQWLLGEAPRRKGLRVEASPSNGRRVQRSSIDRYPSASCLCDPSSEGGLPALPQDGFITLDERGREREREVERERERERERENRRRRGNDFPPTHSFGSGAEAAVAAATEVSSSCGSQVPVHRPSKDLSPC
jgi:hypothetical protein